MWIDSWMLLLIIAVSALSGGAIAFKCDSIIFNGYKDTLDKYMSLFRMSGYESDEEEVMFYDGVLDRCGEHTDICADADGSESSADGSAE